MLVLMFAYSLTTLLILPFILQDEALESGCSIQLWFNQMNRVKMCQLFVCIPWTSVHRYICRESFKIKLLIITWTIQKSSVLNLTGKHFFRGTVSWDFCPQVYSWLRSSVPDPDPYWFWSAGSGSRSRRAKITQNIEKRIEISSLEVLDILFWGLKATPVVRTSFAEA